MIQSEKEEKQILGSQKVSDLMIVLAKKIMLLVKNTVGGKKFIKILKSLPNLELSQDDNLFDLLILGKPTKLYPQIDPSNTKVDQFTISDSAVLNSQSTIIDSQTSKGQSLDQSLAVYTQNNEIIQKRVPTNTDKQVLDKTNQMEIPNQISSIDQAFMTYDKGVVQIQQRLDLLINQRSQDHQEVMTKLEAINSQNQETRNNANENSQKFGQLRNISSHIQQSQEKFQSEIERSQENILSSSEIRRQNKEQNIGPFTDNREVQRDLNYFQRRNKSSDDQADDGNSKIIAKSDSKSRKNHFENYQNFKNDANTKKFNQVQDRYLRNEQDNNQPSEGYVTKAQIDSVQQESGRVQDQAIVQLKSQNRKSSQKSIRKGHQQLSQDPIFKKGGLRKQDQVLAKIISSHKEKMRVQLPKDKKQTVVFHNNFNGNLIIGSNDICTRVYEKNLQDLSEFSLPAELISIMAYPVNNHIFCGLNDLTVAILDQEDYSMVCQPLKTKEVVQKFILYTHQSAQDLDDIDLIIFLERDGYLEFYSPRKGLIVFTYQHSCKLSIQDGIQVVNENQLCLGFAQLVDQAYKQGQVSFLEIDLQIIKKKDNSKNDEYISEQIAVKELKSEDSFVGKSVFCIQQISSNVFIICIIDKMIKILNRKNPKEIHDIANPSQSINYNSLIKIDGFGDDLPYLIFRDSRSIGIINCKTLDAKLILNEIQYARCGNVFSLEQAREDDGSLSLYTFTFERENNKRELRHISINI
ncbi:UNKNOWN [Stylonychia lemnae]|uniref:Uncharacterized protein n=1 Tax=Stylonychia lemnae TaxID=5949 RepID=A0A078AVA1_STYLE|nr:UNKNOWN [Stylonychia lemnae]|eukprot:CDW85946.1 UNKNOWN [Stylonychia lemnae]